MTLDEFKQAAEEKRAKQKNLFTSRELPIRKSALGKAASNTNYIQDTLEELNVSGQGYVIEEETATSKNDPYRFFFGYDSIQDGVDITYDGYALNEIVDIDEFLGMMTGFMNLVQECLYPVDDEDPEKIKESLLRISLGFKSLWYLLDGDDPYSINNLNCLKNLPDPKNYTGTGNTKSPLLTLGWVPPGRVAAEEKLSHVLKSAESDDWSAREYPREEDYEDVASDAVVIPEFFPDSRHDTGCPCQYLVDPKVGDGWTLINDEAYPIVDNYLCVNTPIWKLDRNFWAPDCTGYLDSDVHIVWPKVLTKSQVETMPASVDEIDFNIADFCTELARLLQAPEAAEFLYEYGLDYLGELSPAMLYLMILSNADINALIKKETGVLSTRDACLTAIKSDYWCWEDVRDGIYNDLLHIVGGIPASAESHVVKHLSHLIDTAAYNSCLILHFSAEYFSMLEK